MIWSQKTIALAAKPQGAHLITREVLRHLPELETIEIGLAHFFLMHSSASITINENADPDVRGDLIRHLQVMVPESAPHYRHTIEGPDDMPAHIKSSLMGVSHTIPIRAGQLYLGTWQGLYLCEHRRHAGSRKLVVTLQGQGA